MDGHDPTLARQRLYKTAVFTIMLYTIYTIAVDFHVVTHTRLYTVAFDYHGVTLPKVVHCCCRLSCRVEKNAAEGG